MKITDYLDTDLLMKHIDSGLVTPTAHPSLPLVILTYSRSCVYSNAWDEVTEKCRGLIIDIDGNVVARPFSKFFNVATSYRPETWLENLPTTKPDVLEKLDGSLGILFQYKIKSPSPFDPAAIQDYYTYTGIASKGSFKSEHALWATGYYQKHHSLAVWPEGWTPVFEMICQEVQTHVVHYRLDDHLALLGMVNIETGEELSYDSLCIWAAGNGIPVVEKFDKSVGDALAEDRPNKEGYVLSWPRPGTTPLKVKVKHETFLAMQKIAHAATPKAILEALMEGQDALIETWASSAHPELAAFVRGHAASFRAQFSETLRIAAGITQTARMRFETRKEHAAYLLQDDAHKVYSPIAFALLDKKAPETIRKITWKVTRDNLKELSDQPLIAQDDEDKEEV
jgi:RNA ligase